MVRWPDRRRLSAAVDATGSRGSSSRWLRLLDGEPFQLNDSYYPRAVAEGTEVVSPDDIPRGPAGYRHRNGPTLVELEDQIPASLRCSVDRQAMR